MEQSLPTLPLMKVTGGGGGGGGGLGKGGGGLRKRQK